MNDAFRLISMYVGDFDCLKKQIINFCSDYTTNIVRNGNQKRKYLRLAVQYEQSLPNDFFSLNEGNEGAGCVKSVAAIIGKNGAGKTTLARLLCNLASSDERKPQWTVVLIYELNGKLKAYSTSQQVEINAGTVECEVDPHFNWPYRFFYYSPHFTTEQLDVYTIGYHASRQTHENGESVSDISTTGLMIHPEGNSELLLQGRNSQSSIFDVDEKVRLFEFLARYHEKYDGALAETRRLPRKNRGGRLRDPLCRFNIPQPDAISIGVHTEGLFAAIRDMSEKVESCKRDEAGVQKQIFATMKSSPGELRDPVGEYLRTLIEPFEQFRKSQSRYGLIVNVFMSYAARYIQECGLFNPSFPNELLRRGFLSALKKFINSGDWSSEEKIKRFLEENPPPQRLAADGSEGILGKISLLELIGLLQVFRIRSDEQKNSSRPTVRFDGIHVVLLCRLDDDTTLKDVCRLVKLHGLSREISSFMKFDVLPHMSSGEMCFLSLFSRLYHFVGKVPDDENVVVFLDEAETTLHPEWQRCLVAYCIRFFEVFLPSKRYQLIFASHSPMLLSDIPKGNICCLDRDKKGHCYVRRIAADNTFAANIYDLYATSYFLTGGPIGDFARSKIQNLQNQEDEKIVNLVGDELLKRLLQRKASVCDK